MNHLNHHRLITCLIAGLTVAGAPLDASAEQSTTKKFAEVGGWIIQAESSDGAYMRCSGVVPGGGKISFDVGAEGWILAVPTAKKPATDEVKGAIEIDGKSTKANYLNRDDTHLITFLKAPQLKQIRAAKALTATAGQEKTPVPLAGIDAALRKTSECNDKGGE